VEPLWDKWPHSRFFFFLVATSLAAAVILRLALKKVNQASRS
jgi:hypothetical protein